MPPGPGTRKQPVNSTTPQPNPAIAFEVAFEDDQLLVVVKPRGLVTRPGHGHGNDTLVNGVLARWGDPLMALGSGRDFGLLHRLDRATSGLVVFARTPAAYDRLRRAFAAREIGKTYLGWTRPAPPRRRTTVRVRLREVRRADRKLAEVDPRGEEAVTHVETLATGVDGSALVQCAIETGRLHQIRAHLAWLGSPLEGDTVYARAGGPPDGRASSARAADRTLLLHAWRLDLPHPTRSGRVSIEAPLPAAWLERARRAGVDLPSRLEHAGKLAKRGASGTIAGQRSNPRAPCPTKTPPGDRRS